MEDQILVDKHSPTPKVGLMKEHFNLVGEERLKWKRKNKYYYVLLEKYFKYFIPKNKNVLELGCGTGEILASVKPSYGVGIDFSEKMIDIAKEQFPGLDFYVQDAEQLNIDFKFDYIIISDLLNSLKDIQKVFNNLTKVSNNKTRIIISNYNYLWEPILKFAEKIGLKAKQPLMNWLSTKDIDNILKLEGFEIIRTDNKILLPKKIFFLSWLFKSSPD